MRKYWSLSLFWWFIVACCVLSLSEIVCGNSFYLWISRLMLSFNRKSLAIESLCVHVNMQINFLTRTEWQKWLNFIIIHFALESFDSFPFFYIIIAFLKWCKCYYFSISIYSIVIAFILIFRNSTIQRKFRIQPNQVAKTWANKSVRLSLFEWKPKCECETWENLRE